MTPETYMKRYHGGEDGLVRAISAEEAFPIREDADGCPCEDECPREEGCRRCHREPCRARESRLLEDGRPCHEEERPHEDEDDRCCCKGSMVDALNLLCGNCLASLVDFDSFFFLTDALAVGSPLTIPGHCGDNIQHPCGTLRRFSPCNCDLLEVDATAYFDVPELTCPALEHVEQLSLCALKAVSFGLEEADCPEECEDRPLRRAIRAIRRAIREEGGTTTACAPCGAHCDCDDCCCVKGIRKELATRNLSRLATLTVGPLVLKNVTVLGALGSVLILVDEDKEQFYLVCVNAIEALG